MEKQDALPVPVYPRAVNHVGVGVADIESAIRWYREVLGFTLLLGPIEVRATDPGSNMQDVLGQNCNALLQAHMVSSNGIGIELFQLLDPEKNVGVRLTSGFLLEPEQSTSAIVVHHPAAKYFVV